MIQNFLHISYLLQVNPSSSLDLGNIREPEPVAFTFDTIGWQVLFLVLFLVILFIIYKVHQKYQHNKYRRDAIQSIEEIATTFGNNPVNGIIETLFILKKTALQTFSREEVASLNGEKWLDFLDQKAKHTNFKAYKNLVAHVVYKNEMNFENDFNKNTFISMSKTWIKEHA
jgi:hypothetical protein